jgi:hypothetical protein
MSAARREELEIGVERHISIQIGGEIELQRLHPLIAGVEGLTTQTPFHQVGRSVRVEPLTIGTEARPSLLRPAP